MKRFKKLLAATLFCASVASIPAFAAAAKHGADINRIGPVATGFAYTSWDRPHVTKLKIGISSTTDSGTSYSQTNVLSGVGSATSGYWAT